MIDLKVQIVTTGITQVLARQSRWIQAKTINLLMERFQERQRAHQAREFGPNQWVQKAVKAKPFATKHTLEGVVAIDPPGGIERADILAKFETSGFKVPTEGHSLVIPKDVRRTKRGIVPSRLRPKAFNFQRRGRGPKATVYVGEGRTFLIKYHDEVTGGIYQRVRHNRGKRRRAALEQLGRDPGIRTLYRFTGRSTIAARLHFIENAHGVVRARLSSSFLEAMQLAVGAGQSTSDFEVRRIARADVFDEGRVQSYRGEID